MKNKILRISLFLIVTLSISCEKQKDSDNPLLPVKDLYITFELGDSSYIFGIQDLTSNWFELRYLRDTVTNNDSVILGYQTYFTDETITSEISIFISKKFAVSELENDISQLGSFDIAGYVYDNRSIYFEPLYLPSAGEKEFILSGDYSFIEMYSRRWTEFNDGGVRIEYFETSGGYADWTSTIPVSTSSVNYGEYIDLPEEFQQNSNFRIISTEEISDEEVANLDEKDYVGEYPELGSGDKKNTIAEAQFEVTLYNENGEMLKLKNGSVIALF